MRRGRSGTACCLGGGGCDTGDIIRNCSQLGEAAGPWRSGSLAAGLCRLRLVQQWQH